MPKILTMKDRVKLKLGKVEFTLKPLNVLEMNEVLSHKEIKAGEEVENVLLSSMAYLKFALKEAKGIKTYSGSDYELEFEGDYLSDNCASELMSLELGAEFYHAVQHLKTNSIPQKLTYFGTDKKLEGVSLKVIPAEGIVK
jgi:hypothetical protein